MFSPLRRLGRFEGHAPVSCPSFGTTTAGRGTVRCVPIGIDYPLVPKSTAQEYLSFWCLLCTANVTVGRPTVTELGQRPVERKTSSPGEGGSRKSSSRATPKRLAPPQGVDLAKSSLRPFHRCEGSRLPWRCRHNATRVRPADRMLVFSWRRHCDTRQRRHCASCSKRA